MDAGISPDITPKRLCQTCSKNVLEAFSSFKNCVSCREKNRVKSQLKAQRKKERNAMVEKHRVTMERSTTVDAVVDTDDEIDSDGKENPHSSSGGPVKMKAPISLRDLEGKERKTALKEMKRSLRKSMKEASSSPIQPFIDPKRPLEKVKDFQNASALYDALKSKSSRANLSGARFNFSGCHSIIAVPDITNTKRVDLVTKDLKKIARLPFGSCNGPVRGGLSDKSEWFARYDCDCLGVSSPEPSSSSGTLGKRGRVRRDCGGEVTITSMDDMSHPGGLIGQRIIVRVSHR